jgi:hypothetical protein
MHFYHAFFSGIYCRFAGLACRVSLNAEIENHHSRHFVAGGLALVYPRDGCHHPNDKNNLLM